VEAARPAVLPHRLAASQLVVELERLFGIRRDCSARPFRRNSPHHPKAQHSLIDRALPPKVAPRVQPLRILRRLAADRIA
jgi:hypothetical protein